MISGPPICDFFVETLFRGKRIDTFLEKHLRNYTAYQIHRLIRAGCVEVNGAHVDTGYRVRPHDAVRIRLISPPDRCIVAEPLPTKILYEDPWLIVVDKPPGQMPHPGGVFQSSTLINGLQHHLDRQTRFPGLIRPGVVHRLDRQTSGLMAIPKDHISHRRLTAQFEHRSVKKTYLAIVCGCLPDDQGAIDRPIGFVPRKGCSLMCAKPFARDPRPAQTAFRVIQRFDAYTLVEVEPLTGRQHQIRVHMAEIGFPLLADEFYGPYGIIKDGTPLTDMEPSDSAGVVDETDVEENCTIESEQSLFYDPALPLRRQALHAAKLSFAHPISHQPMKFEAPLPEDFETTLHLLSNQASAA